MAEGKLKIGDFQPIYMVGVPQGDGVGWVCVDVGPNLIAGLHFSCIADAEKYRLIVARDRGIPPDDIRVVACEPVIE